MSALEASQEMQDRSPVLIQSRQKRQIGRWEQARKRSSTRLPWWLEPPVGYLATFPLVALGLSIPFAFRFFGLQNNFLSTSSVLITLIIALIWGTEPAILSILLSTLMFDVYFLPPTGSLLHNWDMLIQLVPFVLANGVMVVIASQLERNRRRIHFVREELEAYSDKLNQANQELERANLLKDQILSMASHELKTPITTIRGHAQLGMRHLATQSDLPPELESLNIALERIDQQTSRLNNLVDDLLDLNILRSGRVTLNITSCDIGILCNEIVAEQQSLTARSITLELPSSPVTVQADGERLSQVMTNVISNAIKYSPEGSVVQVQVSQSNHTALIRVSNQGPVIPSEHLANIFEPFYRAPTARVSKQKGWGLGLAISKQIVEQHHGHIWAESSAAGTVFSIELPLS